MVHSALYEKMPFLKRVSDTRRRQFEEYFENAPLWLLDAVQIEEVEKDTVFVREGSRADMVYFIGEGLVEAVDYRVCGIPYNYMQFADLSAFGGMEIVMDLAEYRTTLRTLTACTVVKLTRAKMEKWLYSDIRALKREAKRVAEYLNEEARENRLYLFMQGADRLALLFVRRYERFSREGVLLVRGSRQSLADETGLCLKSVSRGIKKFEQDGIISREGYQITINQEQYEALREIVQSKIDLN